MGKQHYLTEKVSCLTKRLLTLMLLLVGITSAQAAAPVDFGDLQLGKVYTYTMFADHQGKFTAPKAGSLVVTTTCGDFIRAYKDAEHLTAYNYETQYNEKGHTYYELSVKKDEIIYFHREFVMSKGGFILKMVDEATGVQLVSTQPAENATFSMGGEPQITFNFNANVKIDGAEIVVGTKVTTMTALLNGASVVLQPKQVLYDLHKNGTLKKGDTFVARLKNVRLANNETVKFGTDGTCELKLVSAGKAAEMVKKEGPIADAKFLSFYPAGDPRGIVKATFDTPLQVPAADTKSQLVTLSYGSVEGEDGEFYTESIPYTVEGNVLICDLTNKLRTPANMVRSGKNYGTIGLKIANVRDADGNLAYSTQSGALGSYIYSLPYEEVKVELTTEFTPKSGASLKGVNDITLWVQGYENLHFDGVRFTWMNAGQKDSVVTKEYTVADDEYVPGSKLMTIKVPAAVQGKKNVTVTLNNLVVADGRDHSAELTAVYDAFVMTDVRYKESAAAVATPLNGQKLQMLKEGGMFMVMTNMNDSVGYAHFQIRDLNPDTPEEAIIYTQSTLTMDSVAGGFVAEIMGVDYKLYKNHTYAFEVTAYATENDYFYGKEPLGTGKVLFEGLTEPYRVSDVNFVSITPTVGTAITEAKDTEFVVTFDGLVKLDPTTTFLNMGYGASVPFDTIAANQPNADGMSDVWKLNVKEATLKTLGDALSLTIVATDIDGRRVAGNTGKNETTYFLFEYPLEFNAADFTIDPATETEVDSLHKFTVSCPIGINESFNGTSIVLYDRMNHKTVAKVTNVELVIPESELDNWDYIPTSVILTLDSIVKEPGVYLLEVPEGFFILGSQATQYNSKAKMFSYMVKEPTQGGGQTGEVKVTTVPANGSTVKELSTITVTYDNEAEVGLAYNGTNITISKDGGEAKAMPEPELSWDFFNQIVLKTTAPITEAGVYTITIPDGFVLDAKGNNIAGVTLVYTIGQSTGIATPTVLPTEALKQGIYTLSGTRVNKQIHELPAGIYVVGGKKVVIK